MLLTQQYYRDLLRKDLILKDIPSIIQEIPELDKLEIRIIFPKIIDDYSQIFEGIIYLEELTGQMPIKQILSVKRVGAQEYERSVVIFVTLRKQAIFNFFLYLYFSLIYYWEDSKNVLVVKATADSKHKIVQLSNKEFFYFFNMPIEYDDRQYEWNLQLLFFFKSWVPNVTVDLLSYFLSPFLPYAIFNIKKNQLMLETEEDDEIDNDEEDDEINDNEE
jgi:hypothetical protein